MTDATLHKKLPFYFRFNWDNRKVWLLEQEAEALPVTELSWQLEYPLWSSQPPAPLFDLRPIDVITGRVAHDHHMNRIKRADLRYPLDAMDYRGRLVILDGVHRLCRCLLEGQNSIVIRKHRKEAISLIRKG